MCLKKNKIVAVETYGNGIIFHADKKSKANGRDGHRRVINSFHFLKRINSDKMSF